MIESLKWHIDNFINSEKLVILPLSILVSFIFAVFFLLLAIPVLKKCGMIDIPGKRRAHKSATPRGGGIAIVLAYLIGFYGLNLFYYQIPIITPLIIASGMIAAISFIDDIREISVRIRLLFHFACAYICISNYVAPHLIFRGELSPFADMALAVFGLAAFINVYNFLDGIDGISAMQSIHLSLTTLILCIIRDKVILNIDLVFYSSALILGASIAFLVFNWYPAKIFLGDVGSIFIGLVQGLNLIIIAASSERLFLAAAISSLYYIADGGITILVRIMNKEKFWLPHLNHFFQRAVRKGMTHQEIVKKIAVCNIVLLFLSVSSIYLPHIAIILSIITVSYILVHFHHDPI